MKKLTERQQTAFNDMKYRLEKLHSYQTVEDYMTAWCNEYRSSENSIPAKLAKFWYKQSIQNIIKFTNAFCYARTIWELNKKGYIRVIDDESSDNGLHIYTLEILE